MKPYVPKTYDQRRAELLAWAQEHPKPGEGYRAWIAFLEGKDLAMIHLIDAHAYSCNEDEEPCDSVCPLSRYCRYHVVSERRSGV